MDLIEIFLNQNRRIYNMSEINLEIPKEIENLALPNPSLLDYYKDATERVFWLEGEVEGSTLELVKSIMRINIEDNGIAPELRTPIKILIDTNGGDVQVMWSLINAIKISKTPVYTVVYCTALSAGAHILAAGHKRFAFPGATILVHSGGVGYQGTVEQVESAKKYYDGLCRRANELLLSDTKITPKDLKKKGAFDWYLSAEEAVEKGLVDKIIEDYSEVMYGR
jgi:ATP-dependent Clp protease protease subunit